MIREELLGLIDMSKDVEMEEHRVPYVRGASLKEAVEKALAIYKLKEQKESPSLSK
jgi:hypothetical protein